MSAILYNYLPTELVYTIYEYLHRIYMLEVCKEMDEIQSDLFELNIPFLCRIGECECIGPCDYLDNYSGQMNYSGRMILRISSKKFVALLCESSEEEEEEPPKRKRKKILRRGRRKKKELYFDRVSLYF